MPPRCGMLVLTDQDSPPGILHWYQESFTATSARGILACSVRAAEEGLTSGSAFKVTGKRVVHPGGTC